MSVKDLRERTQAGILDCKKAWDESNGDIDQAIKILKEKGLAKAVKRAGMEAHEGAIAICSVGDVSGMLFLATETDFVAKNADFCNFLNDSLKNFLSSDLNDINDLKKNNESFADQLNQLISKVGENIVVKDFCKIVKEPNTTVTTYLHNKLNDAFDNIGRIGVVVKFSNVIEPEFAKEAAMHIASFKPLVLNEQDLDPVWLEAQEKESKIHEDSFKARKNAAVLNNQSFLMDSSISFEKACKNNNTSVVEFKVFSIK